MGLFSNTLPTFISKAGEWLTDFGTRVKEEVSDPFKQRRQVFEVGEGLTPEQKVEAEKVVRKEPEVPVGELDIDIKPTQIPKLLESDDPEIKELAREKAVEVGLSIEAGTLKAGKVGKEIVEEVSEKIAPKVKVDKERKFVTSVKEKFPEVKAAGQYIPRSTDKLAVKAKNLIKDDIALAEKVAKTKTDDGGVATASELIKHYSDEANRATDVATKNALNDKAADIANTAAKNLTELGRSVQAASILGRLTPEGQVRFAAKEIQRYNELVEKTRGGIGGLKKKVPELTGKQADEILTEMRAIEQMPDGFEKAVRFKKLQDNIATLVPSSLYDKMVSIWKTGLLTGIKTSGLNVLSNLSHTGTEVLKDIPATAVDSLASLFTGQKTVSLTAKGLPSGLKEGIEKGWQYLKTGASERNLGMKLDWKRVNFGKGKVAKALKAYEETIFRILGSEDQPFYYGAKARSLYDQALAQAKNKGLKGAEKSKFVRDLIENPTDEMLRYAVLDAETAVYQNPTVLGKIARQIQKAPGGEIIVPFGRTPSAVATQILNYSPVGIVKTIIENIGKGRFDQRLFSQAVGRGLTGTAAIAIGLEAFKKGLISLDFPKSEREQKLWELEGRKPNSIKVGDKWRSAHVLGPAGNLLLIGGHFSDALNSEGSITGALATALAGGAKSLSEQTFLTGINRTVQAITDPQRSASGYLGGMLASTIPTIINDVARATDPKERRAETIGERFISRVPGARQTLEPRITALGEEKERVGSFLEVMLDPTRPTTEHKSPIILELRRLWDQGFKVSPTLLGDKTGFPALTQEENTDLWKRSGQITEQKLNSLISRDGYWKLDDDQKADAVEDVIDKSKLFARVEKVMQITEGLEGQELLSKLKELKEGGLMSAQVFREFQRLR